MDRKPGLRMNLQTVADSQNQLISENGTIRGDDVKIYKDGYEYEEEEETTNGMVKKKKRVKIALEDLEQKGKLGEGNSGSVYKMFYKKKNMDVALKVIAISLDEDRLKQILLELKTLNKSDCENILELFGAFYQEGQLSLVLEYMNVGSLTRVIKDKGKVPEEIVAIISRKCLQGLSYLHSRLKIIHRDIKPSNILLSTNGEVKIADFGICGEIEYSYMQRKTWVGTILYMSPERVEGKPYFKDTDIWSFGLMMAECVLGTFPYPGCKTIFEVIKQVNVNPVPDLPESSPEFVDFIGSCLREAGQRATAVELLNHSFLQKYANVPDSELVDFLAGL